MSELKPCPFCGQKDEHLDDDTEKGFDALIFRNGGITCEMCLGRGPLNLEEELARKKWNTRPASPALDRLKEHLQQIADVPAVPFSTDRLEHAARTIEKMQELAARALRIIEEL